MHRHVWELRQHSPRCVPNGYNEEVMAKRKRKKSKTKNKKKARKKSVAKRSTAKRKTSARRRTAKKSRKKKSAARKGVTKRKRAPRRTEADMSWSEVRASRRRKSEGREERIVREFERAVNMTPQALEKWLATDESRTVGTPRKSNPSESVGCWSGRRILEIRKKNPFEFEAEDYAHMRKVTAYVARHTAQRPAGDLRETRWRYSLMNWGHDPLK